MENTGRHCASTGNAGLTRVIRWATHAMLPCCAVLVALAAVCAVPRPAHALEVQKLTCRPNGDSGSDVLGGTETRITWEVQADTDEAVAGLSLTVPDGSTFTTDDLRVIASSSSLISRRMGRRSS